MLLLNDQYCSWKCKKNENTFKLGMWEPQTGLLTRKHRWETLKENVKNNTRKKSSPLGISLVHRYSYRECPVFICRKSLAVALRPPPCKNDSASPEGIMWPLAPSLASHSPLCWLAEYEDYWHVMASRAVHTELCQGIHSLWHNDWARVCHGLTFWWCKKLGERGSVVSEKCFSPTEDMKLRGKWQIFRNNT